MVLINLHAHKRAIFLEFWDSIERQINREKHSNTEICRERTSTIEQFVQVWKRILVFETDIQMIFCEHPKIF